MTIISSTNIQLYESAMLGLLRANVKGQIITPADPKQ